MSTRLANYLTAAEEAKAITIACRYLLDQANDFEALALTADCLRLLGVQDNQIHQAMNDPQCDGQCDFFNQENGI